MESPKTIKSRRWSPAEQNPSANAVIPGQQGAVPCWRVTQPAEGAAQGASGEAETRRGHPDGPDGRLYDALSDQRVLNAASRTRRIISARTDRCPAEKTASGT